MKFNNDQWRLIITALKLLEAKCCEAKELNSRIGVPHCNAKVEALKQDARGLWCKMDMEWPND
jgi:hypothetical protein